LKNPAFGQEYIDFSSQTFTDMKKFFIITAVFFLIFIAAAIGGFYPAARVDDTFISFRTWRKLEEASKHFANVELVRRGERPINFAAAENSQLLIDGRIETLTALVEDVLIINEGRRAIADFDAKSEQLTATAAKKNNAIKKAVESLYGIAYDDFLELVLLPQARRDVLSKTFEERSLHFEEWLRGAKKQASMRLYFTGFRWNKEKIE